mgnify:FL=1
MSNFDQIKWDKRYSLLKGAPVEPPSWLETYRSWLSPGGLGLDVASGNGRIALWLASSGLNVTAIDISAIGLKAATLNVEKLGFTLETVVVDLDEMELSSGEFDVITCFHYWQVDLFKLICHQIKPGGIFISEIFTKPNLTRHEHPTEKYLAETGELKRVCDSLEIIFYEEGWLSEHSLARIVAQRKNCSSIKNG